MSNNKSCIQDDDLDETVIFCGEVTERERPFQKRMPRHTIVPADFRLSQSCFQEDEDEDEENAQGTTISEQTVISNESQGSINLGDQSMANIKDKTVQISDDSKTFISEFSSPSAVGDIPFSQEVLDTGILAKYLRKEFTSLDESLAMEQDYSKSFSKDQTTFDETKILEDHLDNSDVSMLSYCEEKETDQTNVEDTSANYQGSFTGDESNSYARSSVSSVVERSVKIDDVTNVSSCHNGNVTETNICKFVNISQPDCNDSIISSEEEGNIDTDDSLAYSITPDEYSITPGKQRLFDLRLAKPSLRAKIFVSSGPYMDKIEETTTPKDVKANVPKIVIENISYIASEKDMNISEMPDVSNISMLTDEMYNERELSKLELMDCSDVENSSKIENHEQTTNESAITSQTINEGSLNESDWTKTCRLLNSSNGMDVSLNEDVSNVTSSLMGHLTASNLSVSAIDENEAIRISPELINYSMNIAPVTDANMSYSAIEPITLEDMSYAETLDHTISNDRVKDCNVTLDKSYHVMQHNLDFEKSVREMSNMNVISVNYEDTVSEMNESNLKIYNIEEKSSFVEPTNCDQSHNSDCTAKRSVELKNVVTNLTLVGDISEISKNASLVAPVVMENEVQEDSIVTEEVSTAEVNEEIEQQTSIPDLVKELLEGTSVENSSLTNNILSSELSVIIENRTLEDTWNVSSQNVSTENPNLETTNMTASSNLDLLNLSKDQNVIINSKIVDEAYCEVTEEKTIDMSLHPNITKMNEQTLINNEQLEMIIVENEKSPDNSVLIVADNIHLNESDKMNELTKVVEASSIVEEKSIFHSLRQSMLDESNPNPITEVQEKSKEKVDEIIMESVECGKHDLEMETKSSYDRESITSDCKIVMLEEVSSPNVQTSLISNDDIQPLEATSESISNFVEIMDQTTHFPENKVDEIIMESVECKKYDLEIEISSSYNRKSVTSDCKIVMLEEVSSPNVQTSPISNDDIHLLEATTESISNCVEIMDQTTHLPENKVDEIIMESVECKKYDLEMEINSSYNRKSVTSDCKIVMLEEVSSPNVQTSLISNDDIQPLEATSESISNVEVMEQTTHLPENKVDEIIMESVECKKYDLEIEINSFYDQKSVTSDCKIVMLEEVSSPNVQTSLISNDDIQPLEATSESISNFVEIMDQTSHLPENKVDEKMESVNCSKHDLKNNMNNSHGRDSVTYDCKIAMLEVSSPNVQTNLITNDDVPPLEAMSESISNCVEVVEQSNYLDETQAIRNGSPKNQKLLDFTILKQQTPMTASQISKQKLFDFSIVDQTPTTKKGQTTFIAKNFIKKDALIDFSVADCSDKNLWNLENVTLNNTTDLQDISLDLNLTSSTNNSDVSNLNMFNESIKISSSAMQASKVSTIVNNETDKLKTSEMSMDKKCENQKLDESMSILDETIEQIENLELSPLSESEEMKSFTSSMIEHVEFCQNDVVKKSIDFKQPKCINLTLTDFKMSESQQVSKPAIVDFSIIEQHSQLMEPSSNDGNVPVSDLIQMSVVSVNNEQGSAAACNSETSTLSESKSADSSADDNNETVIYLKENESIVSHNTEMLSDVQMEEMSLIMESPEKNSTCESFHSIELDSVPEDNKRKMEPAQEYNSVEKKMKVEEPKTPMSMLYKIKNMFRSSEKPKCNFSSRKENEPCFGVGKHDLTLSTSKQLDNSQFLKPTMSLKKPELNAKSKIPCKVADKSTMKNIDFNVSGLLTTEYVKPRTGIPKLAGGPVLGDLSNSTKKHQESKIPSKFNNQSYFQKDSSDEDGEKAKETTISKQSIIDESMSMEQDSSKSFSEAEFSSPSAVGDIPFSQEVLNTGVLAKLFKEFTSLGDKRSPHARSSLSSVVEHSLEINDSFMHENIKANISKNLIDDISYRSSEKDLNFSEITDISATSVFTDEREQSKLELMECSNVENSPLIEQTTNESALSCQAVRSLNSSNDMEVSLNEHNHSAGNMSYNLNNETDWQQSVPDLVKEMESISLLNVSPVTNNLCSDLTVLMENCNLEDITVVVEHSSIVEEKSIYHSFPHLVLDESNPDPITEIQEKLEIQVDNDVDEIIEFVDCKKNDLEISSYDRESETSDCKIVMLEEVVSSTVQTNLNSNNDIQPLKPTYTNILDETIGQIDNLELPPLAENEEMKLSTSSMIKQNVEFGQNKVVKESIDFKQPKFINLTFIDCVPCEPPQQVIESTIVDFSIIEQLMEPSPNDRNVPVPDLIQMSVDKEQVSAMTFNSKTPTLSESTLEKSSLNDSKETVIQIKEMKSDVLHNSETLPGLKINEMSLIMRSLEKTGTRESFHSIELNNVSEDNKRKMEPVQKYNSVEKKMKVEVEVQKTPTSKLFTVRNMFRSNEKLKYYFSSGKENTPFSKPTSLRKSEVNLKSKIPRKVADKSMTNNIDFNMSGLLTPEVVKPKSGLIKSSRRSGLGRHLKFYQEIP